MLLTIAAQTGAGAENVSDHDKVWPQFSQMPSLKCLHRLSSHSCRY